MPVQPGQSLLHYRLVEKIGEGGMGVVWKAIDSTLDREVAIKVLPEEFDSQPDRVARFEREAKLLASLNHPGIAAVYGMHRAGDACFIAMEFVPGEDLAAQIARGALPIDAGLGIAVQVAGALEAAHEHGVIHRDLKPANIRVMPDGKAKVLPPNAERAEHAHLLAFVYVAFDLSADACEAYGSIAALSLSRELDPDMVSPRIRDTLSGCSSD